MPRARPRHGGFGRRGSRALRGTGQCGRPSVVVLDRQPLFTALVRTPIPIMAEEKSRSQTNDGLGPQHDRNGGELLEAVKLGNIEVVSDLLRCGHTANCTSSEGNTPLLYASALGLTDILHLLLTHGATVHTTGYGGYTALVYAAANGHLEVARTLLASGAGIHAKDNDGSDSLIHASRLGFDQIVTMLLDHGANVRVHNCFGDTALLAATENGHSKVVSKLLDHDSNVNAKNILGFTALMFAAKSGYGDIALDLLKRGADVHPRNVHGLNALVIAADGGHQEVVSHLLDYSADANQLLADGDTILVRVVRSCCLQITRDSIAVGLNINYIDGSPEKVEGAIFVCGELLARGVELNTVTTHGDTALILASGVGHRARDIVSMLVHSGADAQLCNDSGTTALMKAARNNVLEDVVVLLTADEADPIHVFDHHGCSALLHAAIGDRGRDGENSCVCAIMMWLARRGIEPSPQLLGSHAGRYRHAIERAYREFRIKARWHFLQLVEGLQLQRFGGPEREKEELATAAAASNRPRKSLDRHIAKYLLTEWVIREVCGFL